MDRVTLKHVLAQVMRDDPLAAIVIQVALERGVNDMATAPAPADDATAIVPFKAYQRTAARVAEALKQLTA